ncbi:MAG: hypothetical protein ACLSUW_00475 [Akkermansia sp.]
MSRSICRRVSSLVREKNLPARGCFCRQAGRGGFAFLLDLASRPEWYFRWCMRGEG